MAKTFSVPTMVFNDFHCDGTPFRFIEPTLKAVGVCTSGGLPQTVLVALDYKSGEIQYQTKFPRSLTGVAGLCDQKGDSVYISTLGLQYSKAGLRGVASVSRFNQRLEPLSAKEIIGAESSFPLLTCGNQGVNFLSYAFSKPFRGVGSAVNDDLEPVDLACTWTKGLKLAMEHCSYSSADVQCREEPLEVESGEGATVIEPTTFSLAPVALRLENAAETAPNPRPIERLLSADPHPVDTPRYSGKTALEEYPRALGDPKPIRYRAMSAVAPLAGEQSATQNPIKSGAQDWGAIMKKAQKELEEAWEALSPGQRDSMRADEQNWEAQTSGEAFQIRLQSITNRAAWLWHLAGNKERAAKNGW
jgi:hypothetical protein